MAGEPGPTPEPQPEPPKPPPPRVKTFSCTNCGASVPIQYAGLAMSATCPTCKSLIDVTDPNFAILSKFAEKTVKTPKIPIGRRGKLFDRTWECIGFMVRDEEGWSWEEYLLFNPYYGYRWLVQNQGHWNFTTVIKDRPAVQGISRVAYFGNQQYKLYGQGSATVTYVFGEFYWRVSVGSKVQTADYIAPPYMLSKEWDDNEIVWSHSEYIKAEEIEKAFKVEKLYHPALVAPNQPFPSQLDWPKIKTLWILFSVLLTLFAFVNGSSQHNRIVQTQTVKFVHNDKTTDTTLPTFHVNGKHGVLALHFYATSLNNSWLWLGGEVVNDKDGTTYPFERNIEYYQGVDSDGAWTEGSTSANVMISQVPEGDYYINLDTQSGDFKDSNTDSFDLTVVRNPPQPGTYFWCLFFLSFIPFISLWNSYNLEVLRWRDSDYSPYASSGGSD